MGWPGDYLRRYLELKVSYPAGSVTAELKTPVKHYQNTGSSDPKSATRVVSESEIETRQRLLSDYRKRLAAKEPGTGWVKLTGDFTDVTVRMVHCGKASVEEIQTMLQLLVWDRGKNQPKGPPKIPKMTDLLQPYAPLVETAAYLTKYVDNKIGLDCLGFVANAVRNQKGLKLSSLQVGNYDMWQFAGDSKLVKSLSSVAENMVVVYLQKGDPLLPADKNGVPAEAHRHIFLIDSIKTGSSACEVRTAESIAQSGQDGLNQNTVTLQFLGLRTGIIPPPPDKPTAKPISVTRPVFSVTRSDGTLRYVYVAQL